MTHRRAGRVGALALVCAAAAAGCEQAVSPGFMSDVTPPSVQIVKTKGDTIDVVNGVEFAVDAADNLGLKTLSIVLQGGLSLRLDTTFTTAVTQITRNVNISLPSNTTAGGWVYITADVSDGAGNPASTLDSIFLVNSEALVVTIVNPLSGAIAAPGKKLPVEVKASQRKGVRKAGYVLGPSLAGADSIFLFTAPLPDTLVFKDTLLIPDTAQAGTFTITGFGEDSDGRRVTTAPLSVEIQSVANDNTPPEVSHTVDDRVEVDDSITVTATDPSGIVRLGWIATFLDGTIAGGDSTDFDGSSTQVTHSWELGFNFSSLPQTVVITSFAIDGAGNRGTSDDASAAPAAVPALTSEPAAAVPIAPATAPGAARRVTVTDEVRGGGR